MAFADFDWATDANYPAGAATWSGTSTKVAPSAGVQADGFAPEDQPPAQWINWLFNGIIEAGQTLEALVGDGTLQAAYARSVALGQTSPHIDVGSSGFSVGGTDDASILSVAGASGIVNAKTLSAQSASTIGALAAGGAFTAAAGMQASGGDISLGDLAQLAINAAADTLTLKLANLRFHGYGAGQRALIHNGSGVASDLPLDGVPWTPVVSAVSGSDIVTGDITNTSGYSARIGNLALFAFRFTLNTTGFDTSPRDITFTPPFGTPNAPSAGVARAENLTADRFVNILLLNSVNGICVRVSPGSDVGTGRVISVCGMYGCS